jgi:hypothetical protein
MVLFSDLGNDGVYGLHIGEWTIAVVGASIAQPCGQWRTRIFLIPAISWAQLGCWEH